jgi:7-cyano-7-deazaguanine synthase in queuosine biosynthesis
MATEKLIVLTSGGLDSMIAHYYAVKQGFEDIEALWVDLGHPYAAKERVAIGELPYEVRILECKTLQDGLGNMPTLQDQIIHGRNLLLVTIAASVGADRVWLSALDGEMHAFMPDKTHEFFYLASGLLSFVFKTRTQRILVETPFESMSKTEIVRWALENGVSKEALLKTSSCYHPDFFSCGACGTCFKRWVAFQNNGIEDDSYFVNPWSSDYAEEQIGTLLDALSRGDFSHYNLKRIEETFDALESRRNGESWQRS